MHECVGVCVVGVSRHYVVELMTFCKQLDQ